MALAVFQPAVYVIFKVAVALLNNRGYNRGVLCLLYSQFVQSFSYLAF